MKSPFDLGIAGIAHVEMLDSSGSTVYRAWEGAEDRFIAIKVLDPTLNPLVPPKRFDPRRRLVETYATDEGVVPTLRSGSTFGRPYVAMPFFAIGSLADQLAHGPMPWHGAADVIAKTAETVARAHDIGLVLADLKPSRVMLADAKTPLVVVYGMSKKPPADRAMASFRAPETLAGAPLTPAADVYSLARTLASVIVGEAPEPGPLTSTYCDELGAMAPDRLVEVIELGLRMDPTERYVSAGQFALVLRAVLSGDELVGGLPPPVVEPLDLEALLAPLPPPPPPTSEPPAAAIETEPTGSEAATEQAPANEDPGSEETASEAVDPIASVEEDDTTTIVIDPHELTSALAAGHASLASYPGADGHNTNGSATNGNGSADTNGSASNGDGSVDAEDGAADSNGAPPEPIDADDAIEDDDIEDDDIDDDEVSIEPGRPTDTDGQPDAPVVIDLRSADEQADTPIAATTTIATVRETATSGPESTASLVLTTDHPSLPTGGTRLADASSSTTGLEPEATSAAIDLDRDPDPITESDPVPSRQEMTPLTADTIDTPPLARPATTAAPQDTAIVGTEDPPPPTIDAIEDLAPSPIVTTDDPPPPDIEQHSLPSADAGDAYRPPTAAAAHAVTLAGPTEDDEIPFRAYDRQGVVIVAPSRFARFLDPAHVAWLQVRRSLGAIVALISLVAIAGFVGSLALQQRQAPPTEATATSGAVPTTVDDEIPSTFAPTNQAPALVEPPATHQTTTTRRQTTTAAPTTKPASTTGPATTKPPATTAKPTTTVATTVTVRPPTTRDDDDPLSISTSVNRIRKRSARVRVTSESCVTVQFSYGPAGSGATNVGGGGSCAKSHSLNLGVVTPPLEEGTAYVVTVTATDEDGRTTTSRVQFTTNGGDN